MLAAGYRARPAAGVLIGYLIAVTVLVHGDLTIAMNQAFAFANAAIVGGLLMLVGHGPGAFSFERVLARREAARAAA